MTGVIRWIVSPALFYVCLTGVGLAQVFNQGSGFFITADGYFITNFHVIDGAKSVFVKPAYGEDCVAQVVRVDRNNDLALLKCSGLYTALPIQSSSAIRKGQPVYTLGFPNAQVQGTESKYTDGVISSLSGLSDAPNSVQITVPLQPGNSGGPLISHEGNVVGVVTAKLSAFAMLKQGGYLPENVNYAIKSNYLLELIATFPRAQSGLLRPRPRSSGSSTVSISERSVGMVIALSSTDGIESTPISPSPRRSPRMASEPPATAGRTEEVPSPKQVEAAPVPAPQPPAVSNRPSLASEVVAPEDSWQPDRRTSAIWSISDNGADIDWNQAVTWCASKGPGWMLPSRIELRGLAEMPTASQVRCGSSVCRLPSGFTLSHWNYWSADVVEPTVNAAPNWRSQLAWRVDFMFGGEMASDKRDGREKRALCIKRQ